MSTEQRWAEQMWTVEVDFSRLDADTLQKVNSAGITVRLADPHHTAYELAGESTGSSTVLLFGFVRVD
jgi:prolyl oligopeptidase PreP (S9A serine peptidase family)